MKRAPQWFTHGKTKERVSKYWPWALGLACGAMYWYAPEPFEQVRVASLYAFRRPVLRGSQWLEVRDVDPETFALDLPPDQIFGPLPLKKQVKFILQALKEDNELADGYVTRLVIDHMDLSLDPPFLGDAFVEAGGAEIMRFAIDDFLDRRPNAKHKFFDGDRFLRFINICANHHSLATELVNKHDGVSLMFSAMGQASNEYARVLGMRVVTLLAFQQEQDGSVEKRLIEGGYLPRMVGFYRQSTGDPTDTRFVTMLISSVLRLYPKEAYEELIKANLVKTTVNNLNISRYKGLPQHIRVVQDMMVARDKALGLSGGSAAQQHAASKRIASSRGWLGFFVTKEEAKQGKRGEESPARVEVSTPRELNMAPAQTKRRAKMQTVDGYESHRENPNELPPLPPPDDPKAPVEELLVEADFVPVALGVLDIFPEYFEASRELVNLLDVVRCFITPFDLLEYRFLQVAVKLFNRHAKDSDFELHGVGEKLTSICEAILQDPECRPYLDPNSKGLNSEVKVSVQAIQELLKERQTRLARGDIGRARNHPIPVG